MDTAFSHVPPGFRFHPTDEELVDYYLRKKMASNKIDLDVIKDVDLYKIEPWDLQEKCKIGMEEQNEWYFFSHKDKKYPTGTRTNRATTAGFWKATGRDKPIYTKNCLVGMRKTLVFYRGRAPNGHKSDWIMHEYRLDDPSAAAGGDPSYYSSPPPAAVIRGAAGEQAAAQQEQEGWVICRVFKKKNLLHHGQSSGGAGQAVAAAASSKMMAAPVEGSPQSNCSSVTVSDHAAKVQHQLLHSASDDALDHILQYINGRPSGSSSNKHHHDTKPALLDHHHHNHLVGSLATTATTMACTGGGGLYGKFMKLPPLEHAGGGGGCLLPNPGDYGAAAADADWDALDRLAAYELNGLSDASKTMAAFFDEPGISASAAHATAAADGDLWSLARSVSSLHADLTMNNV